MRYMLRAFALALVLTFAAGTVAHAVQASDMAVEMAMTADGGMPGCDGCGGGNDDDPAGKPTCMQVCIAPAVAILGSDIMVVAMSTGRLIPSVASESVGRTTLVDPYPPRSRVLT